MKFGSIVFSSKYAPIDETDFFDLTSHFQDRDQDVISGRNVLPPGECIAYASSARPVLWYIAVRSCEIPSQ